MWYYNYNSRGKHRFLTLTYLILYNLSLAPTVVAPPEKGVAKGQPEMQQAMDNMVSHSVIIKKNHLAPSAGTDYPALLTSKTSSLLAEAEQVLSKLPNSKEKQWIEEFVDHMREIADMLEKTAENSKKHLNSVSGTPVPVGLPNHPAWPVTSAVSGYNPFQKTSRMMSKFHVTSPELSKVLPVNEYPTERQVVTKPALLSNKKVEVDELVRELQSLQRESVPKESHHKSMALEQNPDMTSPATPDSVSARNGKESIKNAEIDKNKFKARLIKEIAEFQRMGGILPKELVRTLLEDGKMKSDYKSPSATSNQNQNNGRNKFEMNDYRMNDKAMGRLHDINKQEQHASKPIMNNLSSEGKLPYPAHKQYPYLKPNLTFQGTHMKFYPNQPVFPNQLGNYFHQTTHKAKLQQFPENVENSMKNVKHPTPFNMHGNRMNNYPENEQVTHIPDIIKQKMSESNDKEHDEFWKTYQDDLIIPRFAPYPFIRQNNQTLTLNQSPMVSTYITKPSMNHQIDTQLSDEMKRQLRDGKIIVLSDSLVRSNFEQNQGIGDGTNNPNNTGTQIPI